MVENVKWLLLAAAAIGIVIAVPAVYAGSLSHFSEGEDFEEDAVDAANDLVDAHNDQETRINALETDVTALENEDETTAYLITNTTGIVGGTSVHTAMCNSGDIAIAGGFKHNINSTTIINDKENRPLDNLDGWIVKLASSTTGVNATAYAVCVDPNP